MGTWISRALRTFVLPCAVVVGGCSDDSGHDVEEGSTGDAQAYDHAVLKVHEPAAGSIHDAGEPVRVVAEVLDLDGFPLPIKDAVWRSDHFDHVLHATLDGEVVLPIGVHEIAATVRLPNGDRLVGSVGGVRVQSAATGIYVGETILRLEMEYEGQTVRPSCIAGLAFVVDEHGERILPQTGSCTLELLLFSFDLEYDVDATIEGNAVSGTIVYDISGFLKLPFDFEGTLADGVFAASFEGDLTLPLIGTGWVEGSLDATRVTRSIE
jgi:hypothetical protein